MKLSCIRIRYRCMSDTCTNRYPLSVAYLDNSKRDLIDIGKGLVRACEYCKHTMRIEKVSGKITR